jgi:hypothetical protein
LNLLEVWDARNGRKLASSVPFLRVPVAGEFLAVSGSVWRVGGVIHDWRDKDTPFAHVQVTPEAREPTNVPLSSPFAWQDEA